MNTCRRFQEILLSEDVDAMGDPFFDEHSESCPACAVLCEVVTDTVNAPFRDIVRDAFGLPPSRHGFTPDGVN